MSARSRPLEPSTRLRAAITRAIVELAQANLLVRHRTEFENLDLICEQLQQARACIEAAFAELDGLEEQPLD